MLAIGHRLVTYLARPNNAAPLRYEVTHDRTFRVTHRAGICHKSKLWADGRQPPYRFPYKKIPYNILTGMYDPLCKKKMHENSKIILIEGNVAAGKEDFGRKLANELDMLFMGQPDLDDLYINSYGFDYRSLNDLLPEHLRTCDLDMFHEQPNRHSVIHMQHFMQMLRGFQYLQALDHLFNTGQGVILERSIFTERVFVEAMHKMGWLPIGYNRPDGCEFFDWRYRYNYIRKLFCRTIPAPHLTIYLDVPPEECHKRILQSGDKVQANSNALTPEYLKLIDDQYNTEVLQAVDRFGHLLRYEYAEGLDEGRLEEIIDDIENLDFTIDHHDTKFMNWDYENYKFWFVRWRMIASRKIQYMRWFNQPYYDIAGLGDIITSPEIILLSSLRENNVVGWKYNKIYDLRYSPWFRAIFGPIDYETHQKIKFFADFP